MKIQFYKKSGEKSESLEYPKTLVSEVSDARILEYIRSIRAAKRANTAQVKDRSQVSGGGKKPWRQKGTGRARAGSSRSPIWIGGGVTFGPTTDRNYQLRLNKKERRSTLLAILYSKVKEGKAFGFSDLKFSAPKTSEAAKALSSLPLSGKAMVFVSKNDENFSKSFRNIPFASVAFAEKIDGLALISADNLLFTKESLRELENQFSGRHSNDKKSKVKDE